MKNCRYKLHILLLSSFCIIYVINVAAQTPADWISVKADVREISFTDDTLYIHTDLIISPFNLSPSYELVLTPVIYKQDKRIELPSVLFSGTRRAKLDRRLLALNRQPRVTDLYAHYVIEKNNKGYNINYRIALPYEEWMPGASMIMMANNCGCGRDEAILDHVLLLNLPTPTYDYMPLLAFIAPPTEEIKSRNESNTANIAFETGKDTLLPDFAKNDVALDKLRTSVESLMKDPATVIDSVIIIGYASPEGSRNTNLKLSRRRAASLEAYMRKFFNSQSNIIRSEGRGEDWNMLRDRIEKDPQMTNKDQVLQVIASVNSFDKREEKIKTVDRGRPYHYLKESHYPSLRRSDYKIYYTVPKFSIEKGKEVLKSSPEMLSLEELYNIALTYDEGSDEFNELFETAIRIYPEDRIANLNAASAALVRKDAENAAPFLNGYENDPDALNSFGVYHTLLGEYDKAEEYLNRAIEDGSMQAVENLQKLNKLKRVKRFVN